MSFREQGKRKWGCLGLESVPPWMCQLNCPWCYKGVHGRGGAGEMPAEFVADAIRQASAAGFAEVAFLGGEPTLHPTLPEFVGQALVEGLTPIVVTNGMRLADERYAKQITPPGTTLVLHAPLPAAVQDRAAGVAGYNRRLMRAYGNVIGRPGIVVVAETVMVREVKSYILDMYRWCLENGVRPFFEMARRTDKGIVYPGTLSPEEIRDFFEEMRRADPHPPALLTPPAYSQVCTMTITGLHVKNLGDGDYGGVYSCCAQRVRHGDLRQQPLAEILEDPSLLVFKNQDEWIYGPCRGCVHYAVCRGGCRGEAALAFGCARASCPSCWHIPAGVRNDPAVMAPPNCTGCPLEDNVTCRPRR